MSGTYRPSLFSVTAIMESKKKKNRQVDKSIHSWGAKRFNITFGKSVHRALTCDVWSTVREYFFTELKTFKTCCTQLLCAKNLHRLALNLLFWRSCNCVCPDCNGSCYGARHMGLTPSRALCVHRHNQPPLPPHSIWFTATWANGYPRCLCACEDRESSSANLGKSVGALIICISSYTALLKQK